MSRSYEIVELYVAINALQFGKKAELDDISQGWNEASSQGVGAFKLF